MAHANLDYLRSISEDDKEFLRDMINLFASQVPLFVQNMKKHYDSGNYLALGAEAHKAKSSVMMMGMKELASELRIFQIKTEEGMDIESYPIHISHFETNCMAAVEELLLQLPGL